MSPVESITQPIAEKGLGRYTLLLGLMILFLVVRPFFTGSPYIGVVFELGLMGALYGLARHGRLWIPAAVAAVPAVAAALVTNLGASPPALAVSLGAGTIFVAVVAVTMLLLLLEQDHVTGDTILGGISIYLLAGLAFLLAFSFLELVAPGSFLAEGQPISSPSPGHFPQLVYFSFVTLTTLGYGDVLPATPMAQMLCAAEAIIGQVYLVVFVARLIGLHITERR